MTEMWPGFVVLLMYEFVLYLILLIVLFLGPVGQFAVRVYSEQRKVYVWMRRKILRIDRSAEIS